MGVFTVSCEVPSLLPGSRAIPVEGLLVDSGSELSWIPASALAEAGVTLAKRDEQFCMANGHTITRSIGYALLRVGGFETVDEVVFGQSGDLPLHGARTLEGFGAVVDARHERLVAAGPRFVAAACSQGATNGICRDATGVKRRSTRSADTCSAWSEAGAT